MEGNDKAQAELRGHYGNNVTDDITMARLQVTSGNSDFALACLVMPFAALPVIGYI